MSKPMKFLKNRVTGAVFPFHEALAKNADMEPCDKDGVSLFGELPTAPTAPTVPDPEVDGDQVLNSPDADAGANATTESGDAGQGDSGEGEGEGEGDDTPPAPILIGEKTLDKASKAEIIAFVKTATGVQIEDSLKIAAVREQAEKLLRSA